MMAAGTRQCGFYGKLPAHGDFIDRDLPVAVIAQWDSWLQQSIAASRERCQDQWLDIYLTSPIWRFVLSSGCIDGNGWAGLLVPSVDAVGRYFPLTVMMPLTESESPARFLANNNGVYEFWEQVALQALQESLVAEQVAEKLRESAVLIQAAGVAVSRAAMVTGLAQPVEQQNPWATLFDASMNQVSDSFSLWSCSGSVNMPPVILARKGLPDPRSYTAMLNGQWQSEGWEWTSAA